MLHVFILGNGAIIAGTILLALQSITQAFTWVVEISQSADLLNHLYLFLIQKNPGAVELCLHLHNDVQ